MSSNAAGCRALKKERIPDGQQYEGYLWSSDKQKPRVFHPGVAFTDDFEPTDNPFIVEGWLYDKVAGKSYSISYVDGHYFRTEYDLKQADKKPIVYQAHDLQAVTHYCVREYWHPQVDDNCAGMEVLRHAWTAFAGFANSNK